jgi:biopolymer transport protein ExbD
VPVTALSERVRQAHSSRTTKDVVLATDRDVTAQEIATVFDRLRQAGVSNIGFQTQPPIGRVP